MEMMVMVRSSNKLSIFFMLVSLFFFVSSSAKNAAPAPAAVDCSSLVLNMADCLSYVTGDGTVRTPEDTCCSGLKMVLKTDAECLCEAFRNSAQLGVTLNITKALALPSACRVSAPSVTNCGLDIATGAAPVATFSPLATSPSSTADAPAPSNIGANDVASVSGSASSRSSALAASVELLVTFLAVVSFSFF